MLEYTSYQKCKYIINARIIMYELNYKDKVNIHMMKNNWILDMNMYLKHVFKWRKQIRFQRTMYICVYIYSRIKIETYYKDLSDCINQKHGKVIKWKHIVKIRFEPKNDIRTCLIIS